ncbi:DUF3231 family protein [Tumebacillus sp. ITR2]|uniref:DUF3231 family protein n=1 Tax=Tumebacillus amylolyticus TaxID=2801339 RepID=A0ABS1J726_9BACL|nr:DUF3231 family protein [Tumebacillus amylolyticus]MBL0386081.1 DUF3231 family protein [Tumebacillus amylolyticus]
MQISHNPGLTSSEMAVLWTTYQTDTMIRCVLLHFINVCEDPAIKQLQQTALQITENAIQTVETIFTHEKIPIPIGFTDKDWNSGAPGLYPDIFTLRYLKHMSRLGMAAAAVSLSVSARKDVRDFFTVTLHKASYLYNKTSEVMLRKGVFVRSPMIAKPEKVEFIQDESFLSHMFGTHRPLNAIEISHMGMNTETNLIGFALLLGFAQTAQRQEVRDFAWKGKKTAQHHIELLAKHLLEDNVLQPSTWIGDVTESQEAPFSDKLMCFQITSLCSAGFGNYAASLAASQRTDLGAIYTRMMAETTAYSLEGAKLMIKHGWLEQPPQNKDRRTLSKQ